MAAKQMTDLRGKVVLRMRGGTASPLILEAAVRVARAFRGELRGLFVEDDELLSLAGLPFAQEISLTGRRSRPLSPEIVRREMEAASAVMRREFEQLTRAARIPAHFEFVRGAAEDALRAAMQEFGILAIGEPLALAGAPALPSLATGLSELAGLVVVGCEARRATGPVLVIIDPASDVAQLVDTAERIADESAQDVILLIVSREAAEAERMEVTARAALDSGTRYRFAKTGDATPQTIRELAQRNAAGLVIARFGGPLAADERLALRAACALDCPLLLLRQEHSSRA